MKQYTNIQLKAMAYDVARQIVLLKEKQVEINQELVKRKAIVEKVEVTPDDEVTDES